LEKIEIINITPHPGGMLYSITGPEEVLNILFLAQRSHQVGGDVVD
jgi:hypothetical protein